MPKAIFTILTLAGFAYGAEMEVTDRLSVDGSSLFKSTAVFSGSVGIGTTNPTSKLQIQSPTTSGLINELSFNNYLGGERVRFSYDVDNMKLGIAVGSTLTTPQITFDSSGNVGIGTVSPTGLFQVGGGTLTVLSNGNVGIGTTGPGSKLDVSGGNIQFHDGVGSDNTYGLTWDPTNLSYAIFRTPGSWTAPNYQQLQLGWNTGIILDPGSIYGKSYVDIRGGGLRVTSGNVGIGTTNPTAALHVVGISSITTSITVNGVEYAYVPSGMIAFFNLSTCPLGWTEYTPDGGTTYPARGRYLVGLSTPGTLAGTDGTPLSDLEDRPAGRHTHTYQYPTSTAYWRNYVPQAGWSFSSSQTSDGSDGSPGLKAGTNAPYIQFLICQKN